jgi:hypothetical protein
MKNREVAKINRPFIFLTSFSNSVIVFKYLIFLSSSMGFTLKSYIILLPVLPVKMLSF